MGQTSGVYDIVARIGADATNFDGTIDSAERKSKAFGQALNITMAAAAATFGVVTFKASEFESKMSDVHTLLGPQGAGQIEKYKEDILALGRELPVSVVEDLAAGLYQVVSATVPAEEQINALRTSSQAAIAGVAGLTETFNLGSIIVKGYGRDFGDLEEIFDVIFKTIEQGQTTMGELASALGGSVPIAASMNIEFEELAGLMATLAGVTGTTSQAATQLEGMMSALLKPTGDLEKAFEDLGVSSGQDLIDKFGGLQGAMLALKDYTEEYGIGIGDLIGRKEALVGFFATTGELAETAKGKVEMMYNAQGAMLSAFEIKMQDFDSQLKLFRNTVETGIIEYGQKNILPFLTDLLSLINDHPGAVQDMGEAIITLIGIFGTVAAAIKAYQLAMKAAATANQIWTSSLGPLGIALTAITTAFVAFKVDENNRLQKIRDEIDSISNQTDTMVLLSDEYRNLREQKSLTAEQTVRLGELEQDLSDIYGISIENLKSYQGALIDLDIEKVSDMLEKVGNQLRQTQDEFDEKRLDKWWSDLHDIFGDWTDWIYDPLEGTQTAMSAMRKEYYELKQQLEDLETKKNRLAKISEIEAKAAEAAAKSTSDWGDEIYEADPFATALTGSLRGLNDSLTLSNDLFVDSKEPIKEVKLEVDTWYQALSKAMQEGRLFNQTFVNIIGTMGPFGKIAGDASAALMNMATAGLNPLVITSEAFNFILNHTEDIVGTNTIQLRTFSGEFPELEQRINAVSTALTNFNNEFVTEKTEAYTDKMSELTQQMDDYLLQMSILEGTGRTGSHAYEVLQQKVELLQGDMEKLTAEIEAFNEALGAKVGTEGAIKELDELMTLLVDQFEYFGGQINFDPLIEMIEATVGNAVSLLGELQIVGDGISAWDPSIPAMQELGTEIYEAYIALENMGIDTGFLDDQLAALGLTIDDIIDWYNEWNPIIDENNEKVEEQISTQERLESMGIKTKESLQDQIDAYTELLPLVGFGSIEYEQIMGKIEGFYGEMDASNEFVEFQIQYLQELLGSLEKTDPAYELVKEQLTKYYEEMNKVNEATEEQISAQELLESMGIKTGKSIQDQIDAYVELLPLVEYGSIEYDQIMRKIEGFYGELDSSNEYIDFQVQYLESLLENLTKGDPLYEEIKQRLIELQKPLENVNDEFDKQITLTELLESMGIKTTQSIYDQIDAYAELLPQISYGSFEYEQIMGKIEGFYGEMDKSNEFIDFQVEYLQNLLETLTKGDPLYEEIRLKLIELQGPLDDVNDGLEKQITLSELLASMGIKTTEAIYNEIDAYSELLPQVNYGSFEYEQIMAKIQGFYGEMDKSNEFIDFQIQYLESLLDGLTKGDEMYEVIRKQIDELRGVIHQSNEEFDEQISLLDLLEQYGIRTSSSIRSSIEDYVDLAAMLNINSIEYDQVLEKIMSLYGSLELSKGQVQAQIAYYERMRQELINTGEAYEWLDPIIEQLNSLLNNEGETVITLADLFNKFGITSTQSIYDQIEALTQLASTQELTRQEYDQILEALLKQFDNLDLTNEELEQQISYYQNLKAELIDNGEAWQWLDPIIGNLLQKLNGTGETIITLEDLFSQFGITSTASIYETIEGLEDLAAAQGLTRQEYDQVLEQLLNQYDKLNLTNEEIENQINIYEELRQQLYNNGEAYEWLDPIIERLNALLGDNTGIIETLEDKFNRFGIVSTQSIYDQIKGLESLASVQGLTRQEYDQILESLMKQYSELNLTNDEIYEQISIYEALRQQLYDNGEAYEWLDPIIQSLTNQLDDQGEVIETLEDKLKKLGITTEKSVWDQITNLENLASAQGLTAFEYNQIIDQIMKQYDNLGLTNVQMEEQLGYYISLATQLKSTGQDYQWILPIIDEFKTKLGLTTEEIEQQIGMLGNYNTVWEQSLSIMFEDYNEFEANFEKATATLNQLTYFGLDFDTTQADEQVANLILDMQEFIKTLNPNSSAYDDAQNKLSELIQLYLDLGGVIPDEKYDDFFFDDDNLSSVQILQQQLETLEAFLNDENFVIDFDIEPAQMKLEELIALLESLGVQFNIENNPGENPPANFHTGGIVYAHSGLLANDELMAILQDREVVIPRDVSTQFSPAQWNSFIKSGNVQDLGGDQKEVISLLKKILGSQGQGKDVKVLVHDPGINTALEIFQDEGESWMRRRDRNLINVGIFR